MKIRTFLILVFLLLGNLVSLAQWYPQICYTSKDITALSIVSENYGWAAGDEGILRTLDGETWFLTYFCPFPKAVSFGDESNGWMITTNGLYLMETEDGGNTWEDITPECNADGCFLEDVCLAGNQHAWYSVIEVAGSRDVTSLYYTEDGGYTWERQMKCRGGLSVEFIDTLVGWAINDGALWFTLNGGDYWDSTYAYMDRGVLGASFVDFLTGWAIGVDHSIIHTADGGLSWQEQFIAGEELHDIHFTDHHSGYVVGNNGLILSTSDGGINWEIQQSGTDVELYDVYFLDPHNGWIAGDDGTILHTDNSGVVGVEELCESDMEITIFPNPCSGTTCLRYLIHDIGYLKSDLYGIDGRKIRRIYEGEHLPGKHQYEIDVSDLTAGVYFIRLQAGKDIEVRKLIVSD